MVFTIVAAITDHYRAAGDLDRLLLGDESLSITSFQIEYQQRRVICSAPDVADYLTSRMRSATTPADGSGYSYYFTFSFNTGRRYSLNGDAGPTQFSLSVPSHHPYDGISTHEIGLGSNPPERVAQIFDFLSQPWEEVGGLALYIDEDAHYEYVPQLHGGNPRGSRVRELSGD